MHPIHAIGGDIVVVGDVMLDVYIHGEAERISPEAPVPVVAVNSRTCTLGGAGNVALNLRGSGCGAWLFGIKGDDQSGHRIDSILEDSGIEPGLETVPGFPTITKTRVVANRQQVVRFDEEPRDRHAGGSLLPRVIEVLAGRSIGAVILSDYNKGTLTEELTSGIIRSCRAMGIPVLVDPKRGDWSIYRGATMIKPNMAELRQACGRSPRNPEDMVTLVHGMKRSHNLDSVLLTMGPEGMVLFINGSIERIPSVAREVFDVSGAGDTVIAVMAACICSGYSFSAAAGIANAAAGVVVGKRGTTPITIKELEAALL